jgi:Rrf2 family protein
MLTLTGEYALRAAVHMSTLEEGRFFLARDLATATGIPPAYLAKILQAMVKEGLLLSQRGLHGGFKFSRPISDITLAQVIGAIENLERFKDCILGPSCPGARGCALHLGWRDIAERYLAWLHGTKLIDLSGRAARS